MQVYANASSSKHAHWQNEESFKKCCLLKSSNWSKYEMHFYAVNSQSVLQKYSKTLEILPFFLTYYPQTLVPIKVFTALYVLLFIALLNQS